MTYICEVTEQVVQELSGNLLALGNAAFAPRIIDPDYFENLVQTGNFYKGFISYKTENLGPLSEAIGFAIMTLEADYVWLDKLTISKQHGGNGEGTSLFYHCLVSALKAEKPLVLRTDSEYGNPGFYRAALDTVNHVLSMHGSGGLAFGHWNEGPYVYFAFGSKMPHLVDKKPTVYLPQTLTKTPELPQ
jgi:hypothetical protein